MLLLLFNVITNLKTGKNILEAKQSPFTVRTEFHFNQPRELAPLWLSCSIHPQKVSPPPKECQKITSPPGQEEGNVCAFTGQKRNDSSRLIALLIAPHLPFHPTKEASSPPVSMATSRKRATGRYHFHRRGKGECGSHHLPRFSRGFPTGARKNPPREKKSGHAFGIILEIQSGSFWRVFQTKELVEMVLSRLRNIWVN